MWVSIFSFILSKKSKINYWKFINYINKKKTSINAIIFLLKFFLYIAIGIISITFSILYNLSICFIHFRKKKIRISFSFSLNRIPLKTSEVKKDKTLYSRGNELFSQECSRRKRSFSSLTHHTIVRLLQLRIVEINSVFEFS